MYHVRFVQNNDLIRFFIYYLFYNEKGKVVEGGNIKGLNILTGFTISQKLSWMNNLILALEISGSVFSQKFKATGYELEVAKKDEQKNITADQ